MSSSSLSIGTVQPPFLSSNSTWVEKSIGLGVEGEKVKQLSVEKAEEQFKDVDVAKENLRKVIALLHKVVRGDEGSGDSSSRLSDLGDRNDSASKDDDASVWALLNYLKGQVNALSGGEDWVAQLQAVYSQVWLLFRIVFGFELSQIENTTASAQPGGASGYITWDHTPVDGTGLDPPFGTHLYEISNLAGVNGILGNVRYLLNEIHIDTNLSTKLAQLEGIVGTPFYPEDQGYNTVVTNNTVFNFLDYLYDRIGGIEERVFVSTISPRSITKASLPYNILLNPPASFQDALLVNNVPQNVVVNITISITAPTSGDALPNNWLWTLYSGSEIVIQTTQPLAQTTKSIRWEPTNFNISNQLRLLLSTDTAINPGSNFQVRVSLAIDWNVVGQLNPSSYPSHLAKTDLYGDRVFTTQRVFHGWVFATQDAATAANVAPLAKYIVDVPIAASIPDAYKQVWFQTPKSQTYRELQADITILFNNTSPNSIPLLANFKFEFEDYAGHQLNTYQWVHPIKFVNTNQTTTAGWKFPFHFTDINENFERIVFTPQFEVFTNDSGDVGGDIWRHVSFTKPSPYVANWTCRVRVDLSFRAVDNSIIDIRKRRMLDRAIGENRGTGITFGVESWENIKRSLGNFNSVGANNAGSFIKFKGTDEPGFLICGYRKAITKTAAGKPVTPAVPALGSVSRTGLQMFFPYSTGSLFIWENLGLPPMIGVVCHMKGGGSPTNSPYCTVSFVSLFSGAPAQVAVGVLANPNYNTTNKMFGYGTSDITFQGVDPHNNDFGALLAPIPATERDFSMIYNIENLCYCAGLEGAIHWSNGYQQ